MLPANQWAILRPAARLVLWPISLAACAAILINAASALLSANDFSQAALAINPLNADARADLASRHLSGKSVNGPDLSSLAQYGMRLTPADARFTSLAGVALERKGEAARAKLHFEAALRQAPAEIQALSRAFDAAYQSGNMLAATEYAERIARRWPRFWPVLTPYLPGLMSNQEALKSMAMRFSASPSLRANLVERLGDNKATLPIASKVLLEWKNSGIENLDTLINRVTSQLMGAGDFANAFLLFRLTRSDEQIKEAGFVNNGEFALKLTGNPFEWVTTGITGANVEIIETPLPVQKQLEQKGQAQSANSLAIRFLDSPVQLTRPAQFLRLSPANWKLSLRYSAENLRQPKPVKLGLYCEPSHQKLAELEIGESDMIGVALETSAVVPNTGCGFQQLMFFNDKMPESWKNRYSGRLLVHSVNLTFVGG